MSLRDQLIAAIDASGQTRYEIAKGAGIDFAAFNRFVAGERDIRLSSVERLADYFGMRLTKPTRNKGTN